jgi:BON domain
VLVAAAESRLSGHRDPEWRIRAKMLITAAVERALVTLVAVMVLTMPAAADPGARSVAQQVDRERGDVPADVQNVESRDSLLTARITTALFADERIKARWVGVATSDGHVILKGNVDSEDARDAAEAIARAVPGVRTLQNDLQLLAPHQGLPTASGIRRVTE